jgi:large subunit ribosomal protein L6
VSRVGRLPIEVPAGVEVKIDGSYVKVKGPKGEMEYTFSPEISIKNEDGTIVVERPTDQPMHRALHGTTRSVINNMIVGVSKGFERVLEIEGVGYRAELSGKNLVINVGYSHPVVVEPPEGISFDVDMKVRQIKVLGYDKQAVGQVAADIRKIRPPEPYKGKGIRYQGEYVRRKPGKAGKTVI